MEARQPRWRQYGQIARAHPVVSTPSSTLRVTTMRLCLFCSMLPASSQACNLHALSCHTLKTTLKTLSTKQYRALPGAPRPSSVGGVSVPVVSPIGHVDASGVDGNLSKSSSVVSQLRPEPPETNHGDSCHTVLSRSVHHDVPIAVFPYMLIASL